MRQMSVVGPFGGRDVEDVFEREGRDHEIGRSEGWGGRKGELFVDASAEGGGWVGGMRGGGGGEVDGGRGRV